MLELSLQKTRAIALAAQGMHTTATAPHGAGDTLRRLGCIQLDTISVVRRSHELVQMGRGVPVAEAQQLIGKTSPPVLFEYWAHAACLIPLEMWPLFAFRRRNYAAKGWNGPEVDPAAVEHVRGVLAERDSVTVTDVGGAKGSGWERFSVNKWALEWLLATGEVACVHRRGWQRVYQRSESVIPSGLLHREPEDAECLRALVEMAMRALGVATTEDVADYFRLPPRRVASILADMREAEPVQVEGWKEPAWAFPAALTDPQTDHDACTPLSPFDSLIWHRPRMGRLFGVEYLLEAYKPALKRECGYFGMPVLVGSTIIGRLAVRVSKGAAVIEGHQLIDGQDPAHLTQALAVICRWADAQNIPVIAPPQLPAGAVS
ncbi:winged helix-turn-helix domain-containing protein [Streptomyces lateritius]|uniref:winged helix-turn-helix domain-containing protein n=1 Tax=Streptomyces lateritius TaxID=67313 RepID=UPI001C8B74D8|nr:crosslink repair DNA glycosylase YcaQ family protein [Streptomyces lateritius]MBX9420842.1 winged helix DNA-binding domain-containing protein [Streptomyces lateritius]